MQVWLPFRRLSPFFVRFLFFLFFPLFCFPFPFSFFFFGRPRLPPLDFDKKQKKSHSKGIGCSRGVTLVCKKNRKNSGFYSFPQEMNVAMFFFFCFLGVRGRPFEMSGENTKAKSDGKFYPDGFLGIPEENGNLLFLAQAGTA